MTPHDLSARLDAIESRLAIDALIASYALAFDNRNEAMLRGLWHDDARLLLGDFGNSEGVEAIGCVRAAQLAAHAPYASLDGQCADSD